MTGDAALGQAHQSHRGQKLFLTGMWSPSREIWGAGKEAWVDSHDKTLREVLKPLEHKFLLCAWRPSRPTGALFVKRCFPILTFIEHFLCQLIESWDLSEDGRDQVRDINSEAWEELFFQCVIDLVPVLGCVCEAALIKGPRRLLE